MNYEKKSSMLKPFFYIVSRKYYIIYENFNNSKLL